LPRPALLTAILTLAAWLFGVGLATAQGQAPELPRVLAVRVEGEERYTEDQLRDGLGQRVGETIDYGQIERGIETLWKVFHVKADVAEHEVDGGIELLLSIVELPVDLEPRFIGNVKIKTKKLYEWARIEEGGELYLYQSRRVKQRLLESYRRDGFYFVEIKEVVRGVEGDPDALPDVIFEITEGPRVRVKGVGINGNEAMPRTGFLFWKGGLKRLAGVELKGWTLFNWFGRKFVEEQLQADLIAMRTVYRERGWLDAVVELDRLEFNEERKKVAIHVIVDEGTRYKVSSIAVVGVDRRRNPRAPGGWTDEAAQLVYPEQELLELCELRPGKFIEQARVRDDSRALRDHYGADGYLSHPSLTGEDNWEFLDPELRFDVDEHTVDIVYRLAQGRQRFIREILFAGTTHTRDRVLRREVTMLPGERADLTKIRRSLGSIQSTGFFSDEMRQLEHHEPTFRFLPTDDPDLVDLEYVVEEGRVVDFQILGGIGSDTGVFGRLSLGMKNFDLFDPPSSFRSAISEIYNKKAFHGAGQRLNIDIAPGTEIDFFRIRFIEPDLFRTHYKRWSLDVEASKRVRIFDNYDEDRSTLPRVRIGRRFSPAWSAFLGISVEEIDVDDIDFGSGIIDPLDPPVPPSLIAQEGESDLIGGLFDVRWTELDNRVNPRQGHRLTWGNEWYGGVFGGDWDFVKSRVDYDYYLPIGDPEIQVRHGVHVAFRGGVADPYGDSSLVPYSERFFFGGVRTLRGFAFRGVGPNTSDDQPLGGETMLGGTFEYRLPLYKVTQPGTFREIEMFRALLFFDWGILDEDAYHLVLLAVVGTVGSMLPTLLACLTLPLAQAPPRLPRTPSIGSWSSCSPSTTIPRSRATARRSPPTTRSSSTVRCTSGPHPSLTSSYRSTGPPEPRSHRMTTRGEVRRPTGSSMCTWEITSWCSSPETPDPQAR